MDRDTQQHIAEGLKNGDHTAWLALYDSYSQQVLRQILRISADKESAYDIVQETFIEAAKCARKYNAEKGSLWIWLWTIARRQVALYYRKNKQHISIDHALQWWETLEDKQFPVLEELETPVTIMENKELKTLIRQTLAELNSEYETLLIAKYMDNMAVKDISVQLNCTTEAVRSKLARARKAFRNSFVKLVGTVPTMGD